MQKIDDLLKSLTTDKEIQKRIVEKFSDIQIENIIKNVIDGQINRYLIDKVNEITANKINNICKNSIQTLMQEEKTINNILFECKKFIYNCNYMDKINIYFNDQLDAYCGQYVECYLLKQLAEKFLLDIKAAHEMEMKY